MGKLFSRYEVGDFYDEMFQAPGIRHVVRDADRGATVPAPTTTLAVTKAETVAVPLIPSVRPAIDAPPDLIRIVERWEELVLALRAAGKGVAATALEHAAPVSVNARGDVTIALDETNPIYEQALEAVKGELVTLLRRWFGGVQRVGVRPAEGARTPPARLTDAMARTERLTSLRRRDPVLGAAIDALDLDLAD